MLSFNLNTGAPIPAVGIGCWMGRVGEGEHVTNMVKTALELGYRHIDSVMHKIIHTAVLFNNLYRLPITVRFLFYLCQWCSFVFIIYTLGNEESVGIALRESKIPRNEIFLTTKLASEDHGNVELALDQSLKKLRTDYVDLFLMHWPMALLSNGHALQPDESPTFIETWKSMEKLVDSGKVKNIGVSNFSIKTLTTLLQHAQIVPAVNQVEAHPCLPQHELLEFCSSHKILLTAYSPVGKHKYAASDKDIVDIAQSKNAGVTEAQVLLSWAVQRGTAVVPKSVDPIRLRQNLSLIKLTPTEMCRLDEIHHKPGMHRSVCGFHSSELGGSCFGWTYEQLGWDMVEGGIAARP